jgi:iron complex transport system substrate-binding protein
LNLSPNRDFGARDAFHSEGTALSPTRRRLCFGLAGVAVHALSFPLASAVARATTAISSDAVHRIITVGADLTEIVAELDGLSRLVGCDRSSRRPSGVRERATIGYFRSVSAEGILSFNPDLIVTTANIGPDGIAEKLAAAGIKIAFVDDEPTIEGISRKIIKVADLLGRHDRARALIGEINRTSVDLARRLASANRRPRLMFVLSADAGTAHVAGDIATISAAIGLAGGINAGKAWKNVKPISREAFAIDPPDGIVTTPDVLAKNGGAEGLLGITGFNAVMPPNSVMSIDAGPFMLFGPSTPLIARDVARHFLPELFGGEPG